MARGRGRRGGGGGRGRGRSRGRGGGEHDMEAPEEFSSKPEETQEGKETSKPKGSSVSRPYALTVHDIISDELTQKSVRYWCGPSPDPYEVISIYCIHQHLFFSFLNL